MTLLQSLACITVARIRGFCLPGLDPLLLLLRRMSGSPDTSWAQQDSRRVLLIDFRVQNIEHAQQFYEQHLSMRLWRRLGDLQQGQFSSICGYGKADNGWHQLLHALLSRHLAALQRRMAILCLHRCAAGKLPLLLCFVVYARCFLA